MPCICQAGPLSWAQVSPAASSVVVFSTTWQGRKQQGSPSGATYVGLPELWLPPWGSSPTLLPP